MTTPQRYIPSQYSVEIRDDQSTAVAYVTPERTYGIGFHGKAGKADWHYRFRKAEMCDAQIAQHQTNIRAHEGMVAERRQKRREFVTTLQVGDILDGSWGYDQTNVEFYEVVAVTGPKSVIVREVAQVTVPDSGGFMCDRRLPVPGHYTGEPVTKIVQPGDSLSFDVFSLSKWDGRPNYCSWYA